LEQSPSSEVKALLASQEITCILWKSEVSLPHSQELATCPYPEPV